MENLRGLVLLGRITIATASKCQVFVDRIKEMRKDLPTKKPHQAFPGISLEDSRFSCLRGC
jgi:hypothetical protein